MTWVRLDDEFPKHPKIAHSGPLGMAMQVAGLCYCNHYLTDGYIPRAVAATLLDLEGIGIFTGTYSGEDAHWRMVAEKLVDCGVWDEVAGGYEIHDYDEYQPSREQVLAERAQKQAAGRAGGQAAARARAKAPAKAVVLAESKPVPVPDPVPKKAEEISLEATGSKTTGDTLPVEKELLTTRLLGAVGKTDATDEIRRLAFQVSPSSLVKVRESIETHHPRNPTGYALKALRLELAS